MKSLLEEYGYSKEEIEKKIEHCWNSIFDLKNSSHFYYPVDEATAYIKDTDNGDVRTEGMSYGMMLSVQMNRKDIFDSLWKWTFENMHLDKGPNAGYFCWTNQTDGTKNSDGPAPNAEEYIVMSLFFAAKRWGNGSGIFNYYEEALKILETALHGQNKIWSTQNYYIRFVPNCPFTSPSYHLPHFYELFAEYGSPQDCDFWKKAAIASRKYFVKACHSETGLSAEYASDEGVPLEKESHGTFYTDSYNVAATIGLDSLWFGKNPQMSKIAENIINFFDEKPVDQFYDYLIDGTKQKRKSKYPVALLATVAQSALALTEQTEASKRAIKRLWDTPLSTGRRRYYDNMLYFFSILALSGKYVKY